MVGERIQFYRKKEGMSQEELGQRLHLSRQTISLWENGQTLPTIDNLIRLKEIFGVSIDRMIDKNGAPICEYDIFPEKSELDLIWKKVRRSMFFSLIPSLLWWIAAIAAFILLRAPIVMIGFLCGAFFTDAVFSVKQFISKVKNEKRDIYFIYGKRVNFEVYENYITISLFLEDKPLWSLTHLLGEQPLNEIIGEFSTLKEYVKTILTKKAAIETPELFKEWLE